MKKTLIITNDFLPNRGGVANYWQNLCQNLPFDMFIVYTKDLGQLPKLEYKIVKFKDQWLKLFNQILQIIKNHQIDQIIPAQPLPYGTIALILKKFYKIPYILSFHGMDIIYAQKQWRKKFLVTKIIKNADKIICNSEFTKQKVLDCCQTKAGFEIIYPCSNLSHKSGIDFTNILQKYNLQNKEIILSVGRLEKRKGFDMVIESLPEILKKQPNASYIIIGSGQELSYLQNIIKQLNLESKVQILQNIDNNELKHFYAACDLFVNPDRNIDGDVEGFGIVFLEAAIFAKPAICGNESGSAEAVLDKITGFHVDPRNKKQIASAVIKLLENKQLAQKLGQAAQKRALTNFTWQKQSQKLENFLV